MGALPNVYPGYQAVNVDANREKFEKAWGVSLPAKIGLKIPEMFEAAHQRHRQGDVYTGRKPGFD
jgi:formate dehydrogenase alpha subunit